MTQRNPSAAEALYPHLRSQVSEPRQQQRTSNSVAAAMYPALVKSAAKLQSPIRTTADLRAWAEHIRKL
jgi:hypothetical protein